MRKAILSGQLAYFDQSATPEFWNDRWQQHGLSNGIRAGVPGHVLAAVRRWVAPGALCVDAGCGLGNIVAGLSDLGWPCIGLDYARETVTQLTRLRPDLDFRLADVRHLPLEDESIDCYISQGVIEHFLDGYASILDEMTRVLKHGGIALVAFPSMNLARVCKHFCGVYPRAESGKYEGDDFYQFALSPPRVESALIDRGYRLLARQRYEGMLGIADEAPWPLQDWLLRVYNNRTTRICSLLRRAAEILVSRWAGYCTQVVACKV